MFTNAMDKLEITRANRTTTENGRPALCTTGDARVDAFSKMVRGLARADLEVHLDAIMMQGKVEDDREACVDLFTLWANTRDVRGGKGERQLSHWMLVWLSRQFPETTLAILQLVPEYGSWRDVFDMMATGEMPQRVQEALVQMVVAQLRGDSVEGCTSLSLCAKWAPRPKSAMKDVAKRISCAMYPDEANPSPLYRRLIAAINKRLNTVEVAMSANQWASIEPGNVPARCLKVHRAAFMNLGGDSPAKVRRGEVEDREQCAKNFTEHALRSVSDPSTAKMHGRVLHPHEMVVDYMSGKVKEDDLILEAQWTNLREELRLQTPNLGNLVPLCDVSGSMQGTPMQVAIALSVLISELSLIRDRFLTFSETPRWHTLKPGQSLREKVQSTQGAHWGMKTDFQRALQLILQGCIEGDVPPEDVGGLSLVVLSDMQFDAAGPRNLGSWDTQYESLVKSFASAGLASKWRRPYPVPRVVFWNLRGNTFNHPVSATTPGVDCVSGFSPNLLKLFMEGRLGEEEPNPYDTLRKVLDDHRYQQVRETCARVGEGQMAGYVVPTDGACE